MAAISTIIAGIGLGIGAIGAGVQAVGAMQQSDAQKKSMALQRQAEGLRQRAQEYDSQRKQYSIIREQQQARAQAVAAATAQGAQFGSGLQGGLAEVSGQSGNNLQGVQTNTELGRNMFAINGARSGSDINAANGASLANTGSGIGSLGGMLVKDSGTIARIGGWA